MQFSIRDLLLLTTAVGAAAGVVCAPPSWPTLVAIELLATWFATSCVVAVARSTGRMRIFCLAMAVPCILAAAFPLVAHPICFFEYVVVGPDTAYGHYIRQLTSC